MSLQEIIGKLKDLTYEELVQLTAAIEEEYDNPLRWENEDDSISAVDIQIYDNEKEQIISNLLDDMKNTIMFELSNGKKNISYLHHMAVKNGWFPADINEVLDSMLSEKIITYSDEFYMIIFNS